MSVAIINFGGQYTHLLATVCRQLQVRSVILPPNAERKELEKHASFILSGGPQSVTDMDIEFNDEIFCLGKPILGICFGHQLICNYFLSRVVPGKESEYGLAKISKINSIDPIWTGLKGKVWMSHNDSVIKLGPQLWPVAGTATCNIAAVEHIWKQIYGVQFHPEVAHTKHGKSLLLNFLKIANSFDWSLENQLIAIKKQILFEAHNKKVLLFLSGGVDSMVTFTLLNCVLGAARILAVHIDTGLMRHNESADLMALLQEHSNVQLIDASHEFLKSLEDVSNPQEKRKIIGSLFVKIQEKVFAESEFGPEWILGQGTIYPDTIESGCAQHSALIKTHHNRVPEILELIAKGKIIEPLKDLYKDEVRELGLLLGLPSDIVYRHPFPGPGLAIRIASFSPIPSELKNRVIQDYIYKKFNLFSEVEILPVKSVGVKGDVRSFAFTVAVHCFGSWDFIGQVAARVIAKFPEISRTIFSLSPMDDEIYITNSNLKEKLRILRKADYKVNKFLLRNGLTRDIWQCPIILLPVSDKKDKFSIVLRPVQSVDAMTANYYKMDRDLLYNLSKKLLSIKEIGTIFYDVTNKPPGTIEWE